MAGEIPIVFRVAIPDGSPQGIGEMIVRLYECGLRFGKEVGIILGDAVRRYRTVEGRAEEGQNVGIRTFGTGLAEVVQAANHIEPGDLAGELQLFADLVLPVCA